MIEKVTVTIEVLRYRDEQGLPVCDCADGTCEWWDTMDELCVQTGRPADVLREISACPAPQRGCVVWRVQ